jgi:hypothetical protein
MDRFEREARASARLMPSGSLRLLAYTFQASFGAFGETYALLLGHSGKNPDDGFAKDA